MLCQILNFLYTFVGYLYAVGGYDGVSRQCLSSVECYNPLEDSWSNVCEMSCRRSGAGEHGSGRGKLHRVEYDPEMAGIKAIFLINVQIWKKIYFPSTHGPTMALLKQSTRQQKWLTNKAIVHGGHFHFLVVFYCV